MAPQKAGRYELLEEVGRGSMGVVYRARDPLIGRSVAVKTLRLEDVRQGRDDPETLDRFQNEIRAAGRLTHPNIVAIHDAGVDSDAGLFFITMEFIPGRSLAKMIDEKQAFPVPRVQRILEQACRALEYAHHTHVVHRDIKPANLLMGELDTVKLTDFGTAKILERGGTQSGQIVGTPSYMAPEQVKGRPVDGRADIFALAVILYELLTGERPFPGKNVTTVIYKIVHEEPLPPIQLDSSIHPGLNAVILKGLSKDPGDRYATCGDFLSALKTYRESPLSTAQTVVRRVSVLPSARPIIAGKTIPMPPEGAPHPDAPAQFAAVSPVPPLQAVPAFASPQAQRPRVEPRSAPAPATSATSTGSLSRLVIPESPKRSSSTAWVLLAVLLVEAGVAGYFYPEAVKDFWHRAAAAAGFSSAPASTNSAKAPVRPADGSGAPPSASDAVAYPEAPATRTDPGFPASLLPAKERMAAHLQKLGLADRVQVAPSPNALVLSGQLTPAEHRLLLHRLPALPNKIRVIDQTTVPKSAEAAIAGQAQRPGEKPWPTPGKGGLDVSTDSPGAAVTLTDPGGKPVGDCRTPCRFGDLSPGRYKLSVKGSGYSRVERTVEIHEGRLSDERVREAGAGRKAAMGTLDVLSVPVGADILVNGASTGRRTPSKMELPAGTYEVTLYLKGYAPFEKRVTVQPGRVAQLQAMLARR